MPFKALKRTLTLRKARMSILSFILAIVSFQAFLGWAENRWPELRDVEYRYKLQRLQAQVKAHPDRPLVLLLGSSRTLMGLRPDLIEASQSGDSGAPLIFNFGMTGSGPLKQALYLRRILESGVCPQSVFIEVLPALLNQAPAHSEENLLVAENLTWRDIDAMSALLHDEAGLRSRWWKSLSGHVYFRNWLPFDEVRKRWLPLDSLGWLPGPPTVASESVRAEQEAFARQTYQHVLTNFEVTETGDRAMRSLLDLCRDHGIQTSIYLMPEGTNFCSMYGAGERATLDKYLSAVACEYNCPIFDATYWAADDQFIDGHHLLRPGAEAVSRRFGEQAVGPFLSGAGRGKKSAEHVAQRPSADVNR